MGLRVRVILVLLSLFAIAALAVPLALSSADRRTAALAEERGRQLTELADSAAESDIPLQPVVDRYHEVYGEGLLIVDTNGRTLAARGLTNEEPEVSAAVGRALVDAPASPWARILPWHREPVLEAAGVRRNGELVGAVVLAVDTAVAAHDIARVWLWVAMGCVGLLAVAFLAARAITRWVLRPLDGLERAVAEMTEGVAGPPVGVAGPPELRHFTSAFNTMAGAVRASLDRQRRLIADASHQLRNPLAAVRLRADSLDAHVAEGGRSTYGSMTAELDRLENLLEQLLRLARAEEASGSRSVGLSTAAAESTDVGEVIDERIAFWDPVARGHDQQLQCRSGHPDTAVQVSRHEVEQLLDVALDNAARYAGPGTTVTVSTAPSGEMVDLVVSDDGRGLPAEDLQRAAARFWRGQQDGGAGTGLGLAIASEIAAGHGGAISVEAAPEGGLLVRYTLPAVTGRIMTAGMSRRVFLVATAVFAAGCVRREPRGRLRLAAGEPGGLYLAFAELLADRIRARHPDVGVEVVPTEGSVDNLARLRAGDVEMGLALADVAEQDRATAADAAPEAVARVYENYLQVLVRDSAVVQQLSELQGKRVSIGPAGSGAAMTSQVLFDAAGLTGHVHTLRYRLQDALAGLEAGTVDALVWSGGVPTPAIADLDDRLALRMLDLGQQAAPMAARSGYPYLARRVPTVGYVPAGRRSIGVPDLLLCRPDAAEDVVAAVVDVLATDAPRLVPPYVRGLQYLGPPAMIQTGRVPLHSGAVRAYRELHG